MDRDLVSFLDGLGLALLAASLLLLTDGPVSDSITLLIVGIVLIARSRSPR